jgi:RNA polymerase sporulation-specific sigma factor
MSMLVIDVENATPGCLVEQNYRLVIFIAHQFTNTGIDIEDLISVGAIGLIKASHAFSPDKKTKFVTFAARCIKNEIFQALRRQIKIRREVSFNKTFKVNDGKDGAEEIALSEVLGTDKDTMHSQLEDQFDLIWLSEALSQLSERDRTVMELRYGLLGGEEQSQLEVAKLLGISQSYVSRLEKKIIKGWRKKLSRLV